MSNNKTARTEESDSKRTKVLKNSDDNNNIYNNDVPMDTLNNPIQKPNKRIRVNRNFRVFVIYKNNTELTREFLISQLQIKSELIVDIVGIKSLNAAVVYCKNAKVMETLVKKVIPDFTFVSQSKFSNFKYKILAPLSKNNIYELLKLVDEKGCKLLTLNIVTTTGFWSIGTDKQFSVDSGNNEFKLEQIDMSKTTIKLKVPVDISNEILCQEILKQWKVEVVVNGRKNVTVFCLIDRSKLNNLISKEFYIGDVKIINYSWFNKHNINKTMHIKELNSKIVTLEQAVTALTKQIEGLNTALNKYKEMEVKLNTVNNQIVELGSNLKTLESNVHTNINSFTDSVEKKVVKYLTSSYGNFELLYLVKSIYNEINN
ncbi:hypothetical protein ABK040_016361 [Willaertia magna]